MVLRYEYQNTARSENKNQSEHKSVNSVENEPGWTEDEFFTVAVDGTVTDRRDLSSKVQTADGDGWSILESADIRR
jgi:hypothetical protein